MSRMSIMCAFLALSSMAIAGPASIQIPSPDGLPLQAEWIQGTAVSGNQPIMVLFHQGNSSRGEYYDLYPKLVSWGYNVLLVDLRSGLSSHDVLNESAARARRLSLRTDYSAAADDIVATLKYIKKQYKGAKIIGVGASYSASLLIRQAAQKGNLLDGVIALSPGEYFENSGQDRRWIEQSVTAGDIHIPTMILSSEEEQQLWSGIFEAMPKDFSTAQMPTSVGPHGSRLLDKDFRDSDLYWHAVWGYLNDYFPTQTTGQSS